MEEAQLISGPLRIERLGNGRRRLLRVLAVKVDGITIIVPENFTTDYSSIPWFGRGVVRWSKFDIAGVVHDHLYETGKVSRYRADSIWYKCAIAGSHHANKFQAFLCWAALRVGGWVFWNKYRRREKQA